MFGGVDTGKYTGPLYTVPQVVDNAFFVNVDSFSIDGTTISSGKIEALLDSGTSLAYLPSDTVDAIAQKYGATKQIDGVYILPAGANPTDPLVIDFSGFQVSVPPSEFFFPAEEFFNDYPADGTKALALTSTTSDYIFGDVFLRSLYIVFDLEQKQIGLAKASWDPTSSNVVAITKSGIPGSQPAPNL